MIYLLAQMMLALILAAIFGGALGWLLHRITQVHDTDKYQQAITRLKQQLSQMNTEVAMLTDDYDELQNRSNDELTMLREANQQIPELKSNLEQSQLMLSQTLQRHESQTRDLKTQNQSMAERLKNLDAREQAINKRQADLDSLQRELELPQGSSSSDKSADRNAKQQAEVTDSHSDQDSLPIDDSDERADTDEANSSGETYRSDASVESNETELENAETTDSADPSASTDKRKHSDAIADTVIDTGASTIATEAGVDDEEDDTAATPAGLKSSDRTSANIRNTPQSQTESESQAESENRSSSHRSAENSPVAVDSNNSHIDGRSANTTQTVKGPKKDSDRSHISNSRNASSWASARLDRSAVESSDVELSAVESQTVASTDDEPSSGEFSSTEDDRESLSPAAASSSQLSADDTLNKSADEDLDDLQAVTEDDIKDLTVFDIDSDTLEELRLDEAEIEQVDLNSVGLDDMELDEIDLDQINLDDFDLNPPEHEAGQTSSQSQSGSGSHSSRSRENDWSKEVEDFLQIPEGTTAIFLNADAAEPDDDDDQLGDFQNILISDPFDQVIEVDDDLQRELDGDSEEDPTLFEPVTQQDDLQQIFGIGPLTEKALNDLGITSYAQLAQLKHHEIETIANALQIVPGRIERDNWVGNARRQLEEVLEEL